MTKVARGIFLKGASVLVADDEPFSRKLVSRLLEEAGVERILTAADGDEAAAIMRRSDVDWAVLDVRMEPVDGLAFLKGVRTGALELSRDLPVIVLTSFGDERVLGAALALDCQGFIVKSERVSELAEQFAKLEGRTAEVKPAAAYKVIDIGGATAAEAAPTPPLPTAEAGPAPDGGGGTEGSTVSVWEVPTGALLLEDIISSQGSILLARGTRITPSLRTRLADLRYFLASDTVRISAGTPT